MGNFARASWLLEGPTRGNLGSLLHPGSQAGLQRPLATSLPLMEAKRSFNPGSGSKILSQKELGSNPGAGDRVTH